jgi:hypothetical protein
MSWTVLRISIASSAITPTALANNIHGCHRPNCAEFCADKKSAVNAPNTNSDQNVTVSKDR